MSDMKLNLELNATDKGLTGTLKKATKAVGDVNKELMHTTKTAQPTSNAMAKLRGSMGQVGYQVQDMAVQLQMGQNAMMVFGQQGSQIASIFGPGGAIVGSIIAVGSALTGALIPSLLDTQAEIKEVDTSVESLIDRMDELTIAQANKAILALEDQKKGLTEIGSVSSTTSARIETLTRNLDMFPGSAKAAEWSRELANLKGDSDTYAQAVEDLNKKIESLQGRIAAINSGEGAVTNDDKKRLADIDKYIEQLENEERALGKSGVALVRHNQQVAIKYAKDNEARPDQIAAINLTYDRIALTTELNEAEKERLKTLADQKAKDDAFQNTLQGIIDKADPVAAKIKKLTEEKQLLNDAFKDGELGDMSEEELKKLIGNIDKAIEDAGKTGATGFEQEMSQAANRVAGTLQDAIATGEWQGVGETVGGVFAGSMAGIVTDTLTEAMGSSSFASILGPVAGGLVGGLVGSVLGGLFDNSYVDPTEGRQASQGTGTVLGAIDEKSGSIANSSELIANTTSELVNINTEMLKALTGVENAIQDFGGAVARSQFAELQQINDRNLRDTVSNVRFGLVDPEDDSLLVRMAEEAFASVGSGRVRVDDSGIDILGGALSDILNDTIEGSIVTAYADIRRVRDLGSDRKASLAVELGEDVNSAFIDVLEGIVESIGAGAGSLGIDQSVLDEAIENITIDAQKLSTQGLTGDEIFEEYNAIFSTTFDTLTRQVIPYLGDMQLGLESLGETLTRVTTGFELSKEAASVLGFQVYQTMGELSPFLKDFIPFGQAVSQLPIPMELYVQASEDLISKAGGIEAFSSALSSYEKSFLSAEEQTSNTARRLTQAMGDLPFPETREGFHELMQQQQAMNEAGRENIATMLKLEDAAAAYYAILEARAEEERDLTIRLLRLQGDAQQALALERQKELDATDASNRALLERIYLLEDEQAAADAIKLNVNNAFVALNRSITAELDALRESHDLRVDAIKEEIDLVSETVSSIAGFRQSLTNTLDDIYQSSFFDQSDYIEAQKTLFDYLADIKSGEFVVPDEDAAAKVLRTLSGNSASNYASAVDFQRDQRLTSNALQEVLALTDGQLTIEEKTLKNLEEQLLTEQSAYDIAVEDLEQTREYWQKEIDAINGVDSAVESLETALLNLSEAMQEAWENIGITNQNIRDWLTAQGPQLTVADVQAAIQQSGVTNSQVANALDLLPDGSWAGTNDDINHWFENNRGISDVDIATAMRIHGVSIEQLADARGVTVSEVRDRYLATVPQQVQHQASLPDDSGVPDSHVKEWLDGQPNLTNEDIARAMQEHGVTPEQMARVRGTDVRDEEFIYLTAIDGSHANGLDRVPYDGYVAELHQGEMVLPREQSDYLRSGELAAQIEYLRAEIRQLREDSNARLDDVIEYSQNTSSVLSDTLRQGMPTYSMEAV